MPHICHLLAYPMGFHSPKTCFVPCEVSMITMEGVQEMTFHCTLGRMEGDHTHGLAPSGVHL